MWKISNWLPIVAILLCGLAYSSSVIPAQGQVSWQAVSIAMSDNGQHLAVKYGAYDDENRSVDYDSGVWTYRLDDLLSPPDYLGGAHFYATSLSFSPDSQLLAIADGSRLQLFDTDTNALFLDIPSTAAEFSPNFSIQFSFSPDNNYIASHSHLWGKQVGKMSIWDLEMGLPVIVVPAPRSQQRVNRPWLSPDWRQFLDWSGFGGVKVYKFHVPQGLGSELVDISGQWRDVGAAFSPDGSLFALATSDGDVQVFETDTWKVVFRKTLYEDSCGNEDASFTFANVNAWLLFWCNWNGDLFLWDL